MPATHGRSTSGPGSGLRFQVLPDRGLRHRIRRVRRHRAVLAAAQGPRRAVVLRGRPRRLRLAAGRPRRAVQHRRPRLDGHAADRLDGAVRVHPAAQRPLRHARPDRRHSRGTLQLRGALGRRSARPVGRGHGPPGHRLRREPHAGSALRDRGRDLDRCRSATRSPTRASSRRRTRSSTTSTSASRSCGPAGAGHRHARTGRSATSRSRPSRAASSRRTAGSTSRSPSRTSPTRGSPCRSNADGDEVVTVAVATGGRSRSHGGVPAHAASATAVLRAVADDARGPVRLRPRAVQLAVRFDGRAARPGLAADARAGRAATVRARVRGRRRRRSGGRTDRTASPNRSHDRRAVTTRERTATR